jgi:hypothetical protein
MPPHGLGECLSRRVTARRGIDQQGGIPLCPPILGREQSIRLGTRAAGLTIPANIGSTIGQYDQKR